MGATSDPSFLKFLPDEEKPVEELSTCFSALLSIYFKTTASTSTKPLPHNALYPCADVTHEVFCAARYEQVWLTHCCIPFGGSDVRVTGA